MVLEVLEVNVKVGSPVYEQGHTVLLGWCEAASEAEQVRWLHGVLGSLCSAVCPPLPVMSCWPESSGCFGSGTMQRRMSAPFLDCVELLRCRWLAR